MVPAAMKLKDVCSWKKSYAKPRQHIKKQRHHFADKKVHIVKAMVFPVVMYGCEGWTIKRIDAFELWHWRRLLRVPWTERRSNQPEQRKSVLNIHWKDWCWSWNSILWPPDGKNWLIGKEPDARKDQRQEEKWVTEDEIAGWHRQLDGHKFEQASGVGDEQGSLACSVHGVTKSWTWLSNWTELKWNS